MKNWEKYETELKKIGDFRFGIVEGTLLSCDDLDCAECNFGFREGDMYDCYYLKLLWLYNEVTPMLTQEEKTFVDTLKDGYIARDKNLTLSLFPTKPKTYLSIWVSVIKNDDDGLVVDRHCVPIDWEKFQFIKWLDEPWSVKDLKKLKVKE